MNRYICETCGTQFAESERPPSRCPICEDDRQYVGWEGQRWTTHDRLDQEHEIRFGEEAGLVAMSMEPAFGVDPRSFLLPTDAGNILWESHSLVTDRAVERLAALGGVDRIAVSHPHFYGSVVEWSEALGGVPVMLHEADKEWIQRPHPSIELWSGDTLSLSDSVTLLRCGGHFPGSTALHWASGPSQGGALFSGDALQVGVDRRVVSFMYSYPNAIPMNTSDVLEMRETLAPYDFENVFGYTWGRNILGGARAAVDASFDRYLQAVRS